MNELTSKWFQFIEKISSEINFKLETSYTKQGYKKFSICNVFNTGVELNNHYGFLNIKFQTRKEASFLIEKTFYDTPPHGLSGTKYKIKLDYSPCDYPCRVHLSGNGKIILFYDNKDIEDIDDRFNKRITTFHNALCEISRIKILKTVSSDIT